MANYVAVPASAIEEMLQSKGFKRTIQGTEVVYERPHDRNPKVKVLVYTSIRDGRAAVRKVGADAIKVCTIFEGANKTYGIGRFPRILRVGDVQGVLDRIVGHMRQAYARGSEWIRENEQKYPQKTVVKSQGGYRRIAVPPTPLDGI